MVEEAAEGDEQRSEAKIRGGFSFVGEVGLAWDGLWTKPRRATNSGATTKNAEDCDRNASREARVLREDTEVHGRRRNAEERGGLLWVGGVGRGWEGC